jgi:hypothetical protein
MELHAGRAQQDLELAEAVDVKGAGQLSTELVEGDAGRPPDAPQGALPPDARDGTCAVMATGSAHRKDGIRLQCSNHATSARSNRHPTASIRSHGRRADGWCVHVQQLHRASKERRVRCGNACSADRCGLLPPSQAISARLQYNLYITVAMQATRGRVGVSALHLETRGEWGLLPNSLQAGLRHEAGQCRPRRLQRAARRWSRASGRRPRCRCCPS